VCPTPTAAVERGKYLVRHVARCVECHTPRDGKGQLDESSLLQVAPIWIKPAFETDEWAARAPARHRQNGTTAALPDCEVRVSFQANCFVALTEERATPR
jgi:mono/diheme cytochrome c family protein